MLQMYKRNLFPFLLNIRFLLLSLLTSVWLTSSWWITDHHRFSAGSGLQAVQSKTHILCLYGATVVSHAEWGFALSCYNNHRPPRERLHLDGSVCSWEFQYMLLHQWFLHTCASCQCLMHWCILIPSQALAFVPFSDNILDDLSYFGT